MKAVVGARRYRGPVPHHRMEALDPGMNPSTLGPVFIVAM